MLTHSRVCRWNNVQVRKGALLPSVHRIQSHPRDRRGQESATLAHHTSLCSHTPAFPPSGAQGLWILRQHFLQMTLKPPRLSLASQKWKPRPLSPGSCSPQPPEPLLVPSAVFPWPHREKRGLHQLRINLCPSEESLGAAAPSMLEAGYPTSQEDNFASACHRSLSRA